LLASPHAACDLVQKKWQAKIAVSTQICFRERPWAGILRSRRGQAKSPPICWTFWQFIKNKRFASL
jgi:hypothetical protein